MNHDANTAGASEADYPLRRDGNSNVRLLVVGNSGAGKSTIAKESGRILRIPVMHLDEVQWRPNWQTAPADQYRDWVASFLRQNDSWIIDGDSSVVRDLITSNATTILWLDPPFALYFPRLMLRTFLRLLRLVAPCSPGCYDRPSEVFTLGEDSVLWWSWTRHAPQRMFYGAEMKRAEGERSVKWIRLGGWGAEVRTWLCHVKESMASL